MDRSLHFKVRYRTLSVYPSERYKSIDEATDHFVKLAINFQRILEGL